MKPSEPDRNESHALKCELAAEVLRSSGILRLKVLGWSMFPAIRPEDTLVIERKQSKELENGDIVLFGRDRRLFAHRVVARNSESGCCEILTRGDAMQAMDMPVDDSELLGRVSFILRDGKVIEPRRIMRVSERVVAGLVRWSEVAARVVVGVHGLRQRFQTA